jgi:hypothetical protein
MTHLRTLRSGRTLFSLNGFAHPPNIGQAGFQRVWHGSMLKRFHCRALSPAEEIMPTYRAYLIDKDNRIRTFKTIDAESDEEALAAAEEFLNGHDVEVWLRDRMVGRLSTRA